MRTAHFSIKEQAAFTVGHMFSYISYLGVDGAVGRHLYD
jgi:hypothetical protein